MTEIANSINMSFRVDKNLKKEADILFKSLGINTSVALNMFLTQSVRNQAIPFELTMDNRKPNARLLKALKEAEDIEKGIVESKRYNSFKEAIKDIESEI